VITVTSVSIYNDSGVKVGQKEVAKCDCGHWLSWIEIIIGVLGALGVFTFFYEVIL
jgi:hypothetical protein